MILVPSHSSVASRKYFEKVRAVSFRSVSGACPHPAGALSANSVFSILLLA